MAFRPRSSLMSLEPLVCRPAQPARQGGPDTPGNPQPTGSGTPRIGASPSCLPSLEMGNTLGSGWVEPCPSSSACPRTSGLCFHWSYRGSKASLPRAVPSCRESVCDAACCLQALHSLSDGGRQRREHWLMGGGSDFVPQRTLGNVKTFFVLTSRDRCP